MAFPNPLLRRFAPDEFDDGIQDGPPKAVDPEDLSGPEAGIGMTRVNPVQATSDIPPQPGTPSDFAGNRDLVSGNDASGLVRQLVAPYMENPTRQGATVMPAYDDLSPLGAKQWNDAFVTKPAEIDSAMRQGAQAQSDLGDSKADFYKRQYEQQQHDTAVMQEQRMVNQQEIQARQAELDAATKRYTNDLADTGKYWRNPGNIISSIGAALVSMGSPGDPGIGVRMVQQAVQADWDKRRQLADTHLGELKSNIGRYRQIYQDKELGDRMALAESTRVAAYELERIGAQFEGPIAKARTAAMSGELLKSYQVQMMQMRAQFVHHNARLENPLIKKEYEAAGAAMPPGEGPTPVKGSWKPGFFPTAQDSAPAKGPSGTTVAGAGTGVPNAQIPAVIAKSAGYMTDLQRQVLNERYEGLGDMVRTTRVEMIKDILARAKANPGIMDRNPNASDVEISAQLTPQQRALFNEKMAEHVTKLNTENAVVAKAMGPIAPKITGLRTLGKQIGVMEMLADEVSRREGRQVSVDELMGTRYKQMFGSGNVNAIQQYLAAGNPSGAHERQAAEVDNAVRSFEQLYNGEVSSWIKNMSGGAVSDSENARNSLVVDSKASWERVKQFHAKISRETQSEAKTAINHASSGLTRLSWLASIGDQDPGVGHRGIKPYDTGKVLKAEGDSRKGNVLKAMEFLKNGGK